MNYIQEINAFYDWLETNSVSPSVIVLWYALMHISNKAGWPEEFTVAVSVLSLKTGLKRRTIYDARNELKQKGRIDFKERKGNLCAIYRINSFCCTFGAHSIAHNDAHNTALNNEGNTALLDLDLNSFISTKKTKQNKTNPVSVQPATISSAKELLDEYFKLFVAKFEEKPVINGAKDMTLLKKLLSAHSKERLSQLMIDYFATEDQFIIEKSGYTIGFFHTVINRLLVARVKAEKNPVLTAGPVDCKCDGKRGWYVIYDETANNGNGANKTVVCPCRKKG